MVKLIEYDMWLESLMPTEEVEQEEEETEYPF
jgi:hypothetical protein